ncbi:MAG: biopolymer transporter ExbD [Chitinophagaceae bacterium]
MADVDLGSDSGHGKKGPGVKKAKKLSTRVDLTPMVDLGFLLLTFFVFSSTLSQPTSMHLTMPDDRQDDKQDQNQAKASGALTIILGKDNSVFFYEGEPNPTGANWKESSLSDIRGEIVKKKQSTASDDFVVVIMPGDNSTYENVVSILDEMKISIVERYALVNIDEATAKVLASKGK